MKLAAMFIALVLSGCAGAVGSGGGGNKVIPASITASPVSATVTAGQAATFTVTATGTAPLTYQWQRNGANINAAGSATYTISATTMADNAAKFLVVVSNSAGSATSAAAILTVNPAPVAPAISSPPANDTVTVGQTATFSVTATGTAPLTYQWQKGGVNISGATSSSYTTPATTLADNATKFDVVVSNAASSVTSASAALTVNPAVVAPGISVQPANQTVTVGQTATFSVTASGTAPLTYQWQKGSVNISGATSSSYTTPATTLADNSTKFDVVVSNSAGSATSNNATLTVNAAPVAPSITTQPANQTVNAGQTASFSVVASGTAPLTYQWQKGGANIGGATSASYTTPATTLADSSTKFDVVVSNAAGSATSTSATLTVNPVAPTISTQPSNQTVNAGQTATFSVTATGTAPLSYQWQENGANIAGATSASYTTPVTTTSESGEQFRVMVSNSAGNILSSTATLTVNQANNNSTVDVVTYHYDNLRTGQNPNELMLTPANVTSAKFGKLGSFSVDGKVDAQPLYLSAVAIPGNGAKNVLYVVTEHDSIYAFDADSINGTTTAFLWKSTALLSGEQSSDDRGCGQVSPEIGITATPVIDRARNAIYVVAMSKDGNG